MVLSVEELNDIINNKKSFKFNQINKKRQGAHDRYEKYKSSKNYEEFKELGGNKNDFKYDYQKGFIILDDIGDGNNGDNDVIDDNDEILSNSSENSNNLSAEIEDVVETAEEIAEIHMNYIISEVSKPEINVKDILKKYDSNNLVDKYFGDKRYSMIDLFAGTGAFSIAFSKYNINSVFANDFCNNSEQIFNLNHNIKLFNKDLINVKNEDIPKHNILCGGFPCQPFSIAGLQQGFNDERSNVFWKILSIIKYHTPNIVILENVKNLRSHDNGKTFKTIYNELSKLGYFIHHDILNTAKITNIPQNRERIYIICFKDKKLYDMFNFNFEEIICKQINELLEENVPDKYYYTDRFKVYESVKDGVTKDIDENVLYQYRRYYVRENKNNVCPTLTANMGSGGHNVPLLKDKKGIRKLTPRECFNLQGFPNDYKLPNINDSSLYKLAGNAVSVPVVELITEKISKLIHL